MINYYSKSAFKTFFQAFCAVICIFVFSALVSAQSQTTTGLIQGTVTDANGARVENAGVTIENTQTGFKRTIITNGEGFFSAPLLPLGVYRVTIERAGFASVVNENLELTIGQTLNLPIELKIGAATETVTVTAEAQEGVETGRTEQSTLINQRSVENLPINRRDFSRFVLLTPGVAVTQGRDGEEITINGQKGIQNNISIDGADANNPFFGAQRGGQRPAFTVSLEAIKEFQVVPVGASAEFGRASGGFINAVTKSGTNDFSGAAFVFFRNQKLASQNPDAVRADLPTEDFRNYQFGGNFGGPIKKDRAFFFVAYERNDGRSEKPNRIDARLVNLFAARFNSPNEQGIIERTNVADVLLAKFDWQINNDNLLTLRHNYSRAKQVNGTFDVPTWGASANGREQSRSNSFIAQLVTNFSPSLLNEFRFQYAPEDRPRFYDGPDLPDTTIGTFDGTLSYRFGRPYFLPVAPQTDTRLQFTDNFTVIAGNHTVKFGADINSVKTTNTFIGFARGRYIFAAPTIDGAIEGFQNYINGVNANALAAYFQLVPIGRRTIDEIGTQEIKQVEPGVYVQDNWNARRDLTLNLGLRWEAQYHPQPLSRPQNTRYAQFLNDPRFPSDGTIPDFTGGWQPRFGLAYAPGGDQKTAIRLGAGIYYARIPGILLAGARNSDGAISGTIFTSGSFGLPISAYPRYPGIYPVDPNFAPLNPGVTVFERNFKNPRSVQLSASVERELFKDYQLQVAFNYALSTNLTRVVDRNDARLYGGVSPFSRADGSGIGVLTSNESSARSLYRGLSVNLNKRFSDRFQFQTNYTLSFDYSDDDNEGDPFTFRYADPNNFQPEYNYSDRDQRHRFNAFATVAAPFGVNISPIVQFRSAQPTSVPNRVVNGQIIKRNTLRRDNEFFSFDLRAAKIFKLGEKVSLEGIFEVFNLFNNVNRRIEARLLTFNFDGSITSGFGDPRQAQLGLRLKF